MTVNKLLIFF